MTLRAENLFNELQKFRRRSLQGPGVGEDIDMTDNNHDEPSPLDAISMEMSGSRDVDMTDNNHEDPFPMNTIPMEVSGSRDVDMIDYDHEDQGIYFEEDIFDHELRSDQSSLEASLMEATFMEAATLRQDIDEVSGESDSDKVQDSYSDEGSSEESDNDEVQHSYVDEVSGESDNDEVQHSYVDEVQHSYVDEVSGESDSDEAQSVESRSESTGAVECGANGCHAWAKTKQGYCDNRTKGKNYCQTHLCAEHECNKERIAVDDCNKGRIGRKTYRFCDDHSCRGITTSGSRCQKSVSCKVAHNKPLWK
jgi:hypothetical protein